MILRRKKKKEEDNANYYVALVHATSLAIRAEKLCKLAGLNVKLIPTPRHISSDCGTALRFLEVDKDTVIKVLTEGNLEYDHIGPL